IWKIDRNGGLRPVDYPIHYPVVWARSFYIVHCAGRCYPDLWRCLTLRRCVCAVSVCIGSIQERSYPQAIDSGCDCPGSVYVYYGLLPGYPQKQNILPTTFFNTDAWAAPVLGLGGGILTFLIGIYYLNWRKKVAKRRNEGYGKNHKNEPEELEEKPTPPVYLAILPLICVAVFNKLLGMFFGDYYSDSIDFSRIGIEGINPVDVSAISAIWAVSGGLIIGILVVILFSFNRVKNNLTAGLNLSVGGALLATLNTASEYGFGVVIASLP